MPNSMSERMPAIVTTNGTRHLVDPEDYDRLKNFTWYEYPNGSAYRRDGGWKGRAVRLNREVLGVDQKNLRVCFRSGNPRDCRRSNLEIQHVRAKTGPRASIPPWRGSSRFRGVSWHKRSARWQVVIRNPETGKLEHLGFWPGTPLGEIRAAEVYDGRAKQLHGGRAVLNFARVRRRRASTPEAQGTR